MSNGMSSTNKGFYKECKDCIFQKDIGTNYPCEKSHRAVRKSSNVKYERDFVKCGLFSPKS